MVNSAQARRHGQHGHRLVHRAGQTELRGRGQRPSAMDQGMGLVAIPQGVAQRHRHAMRPHRPSRESAMHSEVVMTMSTTMVTMAGLRLRTQQRDEQRYAHEAGVQEAAPPGRQKRRRSSWCAVQARPALPATIASAHSRYTWPPPGLSSCAGSCVGAKPVQHARQREIQHEGIEPRNGWLCNTRAAARITGQHQRKGKVTQKRTAPADCRATTAGRLAIGQPQPHRSTMQNANWHIRTRPACLRGPAPLRPVPNLAQLRSRHYLHGPLPGAGRRRFGQNTGDHAQDCALIQTGMAPAPLPPSPLPTRPPQRCASAKA